MNGVTEEMILKYIKPNLDKQHTSEASFLATVIEFLEMLPETKMIRITMQKSGISDIIVCYKGKFVALELKDDIGTATQQQIEFIEDILAAGGKAAVCRTLREVYNTLTN